MTRRLVTRIGLGIAFTTVVATAATVPASAAPAVHTAVVKGQVFGDANSNARVDHGESLPGAKLDFYNLDMSQDYRVSTGAHGRFRVVLPTGRYQLTGQSHRWKVIGKNFHLHADGRTLSVRAVKPLGKVLKAGIRFTKDKYRPGDRAHVVVTLTNTGSKVLRGIGAECDHVGGPGELVNRGSGWGKLAVDGPGVTIEAHKTRTFDVHDNVPASARGVGQVAAECDFGYALVDAGYRPEGYDTAKVPGERGAIEGEVAHSRHGKLIGLKGVRVVLADPTTCPVYTRKTTTDADGHFHIRQAPAGQTYKIYLYPTKGWKVRGQNPAGAPIFGHDTSRFGFEVVRGHKHVPAPPTKCS